MRQEAGESNPLALKLGSKNAFISTASGYLGVALHSVLPERAPPKIFLIKVKIPRLVFSSFSIILRFMCSTIISNRE